jgi:cyclic-di-GMP phosphodiesterase TipF (flagellum assembly factor)
VVDLLDYDVRFGQGFLFAPPRPLRPEGASSPSNGTAPTDAKLPDSSIAINGVANGSAKVSPTDVQAAAPRMTGTAALVRRIAGPI